MEQFYLRSTYAPTPPLQIEDLQSDTSVVNIIGTSLANIIVMLIIVFSFVGALNFGMDITVGEKERGSFRLYSEFKDKIQSIFAGKLVFTSFCAALTAALGIVGILLSSVAVDTVYGSAATQVQAISTRCQLSSNTSICSILPISSSYFVTSFQVFFSFRH